MRRALRLNFVVPTVLAALAVTGLQFVAPQALPAADAAIGSAWGSITNLSTETRPAFDQDLSLSSDGTVAVGIWARSTAGSDVIQTATATVVGRDALWSSPVDLTAQTATASAPQVKVSADGTAATAVWLRNVGDSAPYKKVVQSASATITDGVASWSAPVTLSSVDRVAYLPQVAISADGSTAAAIWRETGGAAPVLVTATAAITDGNPAWESAATLELAGDWSDDAQIDISATGSTVVAIWNHSLAGSSGQRVIQTASASLDDVNGLVWSDAATTLSIEGPSLDAYVPQVRLTPDGARATAVWERRVLLNGTKFIIESASATVDGSTSTWSETVSVTDPVAQDLFPALALSTNGDVAAVTWQRAASSATTWVATAAIDGTTATWSTPLQLSADGGYAKEPQVAISANGGKALAVWTRSNGMRNIIQSSSAVISAGVGDWSVPRDISPNTQGSEGPSVGMSANGLTATVLWKKSSEYPTVVQSASGVLGPLVVNTSPPTVAGAVKLGQPVGIHRGTWTGSPTYTYQWRRCDADGLNCTNIGGATAASYTITQADVSGSVRAIVYATGTYGTAAATTPAAKVGAPSLEDWGPPVGAASNGTTNPVASFQMAADGRSGVATWLASDGANNRVYAAIASINGTTLQWHTPSVALSAAGQNAESPSVSLSADGGTAVAIWRRSNGSDKIAQASVATITDGVADWADAVDLSLTGRSVENPAIALSADGLQAVAMWVRYNGGVSYVIQTSTGSVAGDATTWSSPLQLSLDGAAAGGPSVGISADGTAAIASWIRSDGTNNRVQARAASIDVAHNAATWSSLEWVSSGEDSANTGTLAFSSDGSTAISTWSQGDVTQAAVAEVVDGVPSWSPPVDLAPAISYPGRPALSADGSRATAIWVKNVTGGQVVQSASATIDGNAATWSPSTDLSLYAPSAGSPQVRVSADGGRATAAWNTDKAYTTSATVTGNVADWWLPRPFATGGTGPSLALSADGTRAATTLTDYNGTWSVNGTAGVVTADPVLMEDPSISGVPATGRTLTADPGSWSGSPTFGYQWRRCDVAGSPCVDVGADQATYQLGAADLGKRIKVLITATRSSGQIGHAASDLTDAIVESPVNTEIPQISGTARVGQFLTATPGTWTGDPAPTYTYQWQRCTSMAACSDIDINATSSTYTVAADDAGFTLRVVVTGSNSGDSASAASLPSATVSSGSGGGGGGGGGTLAVNSGAPTISGTESVGQTLTASPGTWSDAPTFAYQWQRCDAQLLTCAAIATVSAGPTYTLTTADAGSRIRVVVTATTTGGAATAYSAATGTIGGLPALKVRIPGVETVHVYSRIKLSTSAHVKRWRIEFSRPIFQKGVGKVSVIRGTGTPPDAITVGWYNGRKVTLSVTVVTKSGSVLTKEKLVDPVLG